MIEKLSFGEPFIETRWIENEDEVISPGCCILLNLDLEKEIRVEDQFALPPLQTMHVRDARFRVPGRALMICNVGTLDLTDLQALDVLRRVWKSKWEQTHLEKDCGVPYYKSAKVTRGDITMNFCLVSEPDCPSGIHREHDRRIRELHVQVVGQGAVDLLRSDNPDDVFATMLMSTGNVHMATWDAQGNYPWHRYRSKSRCIFLGVEIG